ncbi:MAG: hypothetical protein OXF03_10140 [Gammaproteobacteria bacterium]|nr:hypothetical protein [Gammaproteobacteria bacterium]
MKNMACLVLAAAASLGGAAAADSLRDDLMRCAQLNNSQVRLACYDALASASGAGNAAVNDDSVPASGIGDAAVNDDSFSASGAGDAAAANDSVPTSSNASGASSQPESRPSLAERAFGMLPGGGETNRIRSRVVGKVNGLRHGMRFTLENGQVWQQTEKSNRNYRASNPEVEIRQGFMNSYRMRLEGINGRIRVRRVK